MRALAFVFISLATLCISESALADLQSDIDLACSTGGSVEVPATVTIFTPLNLKCPPGNNRVIKLKGAPSTITCSASASPCLVVGSTTGLSRPNLSVSDIHLKGPGRGTVGSVGIRVLATADESTFSDVKIDGFELGLHVFAPSTDLLEQVYFDTLRIGVTGRPSNPSVNTAIHLDGFMGNIHFSTFHLASWKRLIVADGPAGNGADASFVAGTFNLTKEPGTPAIHVSASDGGMKNLNISNIQDWETAVPFVELGNTGRVIISNVNYMKDVWQTPEHPAFHILPGAFAYLMISNSFLGAQSTGANLMKLEGVGSIVWITGSHINGVIDFSGTQYGQLVGNWCAYAPIGNVSLVRMSGNTGHCPDQ